MGVRGRKRRAGGDGTGTAASRPESKPGHEGRGFEQPSYTEAQQQESPGAKSRPRRIFFIDLSTSTLRAKPTGEKAAWNGLVIVFLTIFSMYVATRQGTNPWLAWRCTGCANSAGRHRQFVISKRLKHFMASALCLHFPLCQWHAGRQPPATVGLVASYSLTLRSGLQARGCDALPTGFEPRARARKTRGRARQRLLTRAAGSEPSGSAAVHNVTYKVQWPLVAVVSQGLL